VVKLKLFQFFNWVRRNLAIDKMMMFLTEKDQVLVTVPFFQWHSIVAPWPISGFADNVCDLAQCNGSVAFRRWERQTLLASRKRTPVS